MSSSSTASTSSRSIDLLVRLRTDDVAPVPAHSVSTVTAELAELHNDVHNLGAGPLPVDEQPVRPSLSSSTDQPLDHVTPFGVPLSVAAEYADKLSSLQQLLEVNEKITGFCTLPGSQVILTIDESQRDKLFRRQYPVPHSLWSLADAIVQRWVNEGKVVPAPVGCPFNLPLTFAPKKDEEGKLTGVRVCLDTRVLNSILLNSDRFQIPYIRDTLSMFAHCSLFGEFDLSEAYLQFELHPDSRPFTAFTWSGVQLMFAGVPFGIDFIPSHFQRSMSYLFHDLSSFTLPYFDNLPHGATNWSDHLDHAIIIVDRCNKANLRIKPSSVKIGRSHMKYLGHILSSHGVGIDPDKVATVRDYQYPTTGEQMMQFLGTTGVHFCSHSSLR